jgi:hypothetical protein
MERICPLGRDGRVVLCADIAIAIGVVEDCLSPRQGVSVRKPARGVDFGVHRRERVNVVLNPARGRLESRRRSGTICGTIVIVLTLISGAVSIATRNVDPVVATGLIGVSVETLIA